VAAANDFLYEADAAAGLAGASKTSLNPPHIKTKKLIKLKQNK
jgi:hypothetical protein